MPQVVEFESYHPGGKQASFHASPAKKRLLLGAYGAGKTTAEVWESVKTAFRWKGCLIGIFRKTKPALHDTTEADFRAILPSEFVARERKTEARQELELIGGSRIWFRSLDDWRKLGSTAFDLIIVDEAWEITETDYDTLLGRLRGRTGPRRMVLATNPPNVSHWLYKRFVKEPEEDSAVFHVSTYDNAANLPADYIADLEKKPLNFRRKFLLGEWGFLSEGAPVYQGFTLEHHLNDLHFTRGLPLLMGMDFGFQHPFALWGQLIPTGHVNVLRELMGTRVEFPHFLSHQVVPFIGETFPGIKTRDIELYVDRAGEQNHGFGTAIDHLRDAGFEPQFRYLDLGKSIDAIRALVNTWHLGRPLIQVDRSCRIYYEGMAGGYVMDDRPGHEDEPKKDGFYDHGQDCGRYMLSPIALPLVAATEGPRRMRRPRVAV